MKRQIANLIPLPEFMMEALKLGVMSSRIMRIQEEAFVYGDYYICCKRIGADLVIPPCHIENTFSAIIEKELTTADLPEAIRGLFEPSDFATRVESEAIKLLDNTCHGSCAGCLAKGLCHEIGYQYTVDCDGESKQTPAEIRAESMEGIEI